MPKYQRNKGKRGEYECINFWKELFPKAHRHLEYQKFAADEGIDVQLDKWHVIQSKIGSTVPKTAYKFLKQIKDKQGQFGFVQMRRDNEKPIVMLWASDFKELFQVLIKEGIVKVSDE